jgi:hypothetical protein
MPSSRQPYSPADLARIVAQPGYHVVGEPLPALPSDTPEGVLLAEIRKLATPHGWLVYHTYDSRKSEPGFPDTCLTNGTSLLMYELKDNRRKPTKDQEGWLSLLAHTGKVECGIWRPRDWPIIAARLTRKEHPC